MSCVTWCVTLLGVVVGVTVAGGLTAVVKGWTRSAATLSRTQERTETSADELEDGRNFPCLIHGMESP